MKLAICDDEKDIRNYIEKCIREINPESDVIKYSDGREILKPGFDADILFLDIQMKYQLKSVSLKPGLYHNLTGIVQMPGQLLLNLSYGILLNTFWQAY